MGWVKMLKRILYILLILIILYYAFIINFKLRIMHIQMQEIEIIIQNINKKINNISNSNSLKKEIYVNVKLKITAYSSEINQTDSDPNIGAWNNPVRQGMIAVSRDLEKLGLTNGVPIIIEGYEHVNTIILDKMGQYKKIKGRKIEIKKTLDIWMKSRQEALEWGVKYLTVKIPIKHINIEAFMAKIGD